MSVLLSIQALMKSFPGGRAEKHGRVHAVDGVSLEVDEGELFTLLGPSGCGKTTTLRCIAGLELPDRGEISVAGRTLFSSQRGTRIPASERGLGMVFQSYAIWPHMNVFDNVAFPLKVLPRRKRPPRAVLRERVDRVLAVVKLDHLVGPSGDGALGRSAAAACPRPGADHGAAAAAPGRAAVQSRREAPRGHAFRAEAAAA